MPTAATTARHSLAEFTMPSRRALLGGLLIAIAALLAFAGASSHGGPSRTRIVVARRPLGIGQTLAADDLAIETVAISSDLAAHGFDEAGPLVGTTTLAPIAEGELVQHSAVRSPGGTLSSSSTISFPIDRERAFDGRLRVGDTVDVLGTYGTGLDARTDLLASAVTIAQIDDSSSTSISGGNRLVLTVSLADAGKLLDVAHAAQVAALTLVRAAPGSVIGRSTSSPLPAGLGTNGPVQP